MTGRPLLDQLLGSQDDVCLRAVEERQQRSGRVSLDVAPVASEEAFEVAGREVLAAEHGRWIEHRSRRDRRGRRDRPRWRGPVRGACRGCVRRRGIAAPPHAAVGPSRCPRVAEVLDGRRTRVVGLERPEEGDLAARARLETNPSRLKRRQRELVLVGAARESRPAESDRDVRRAIAQAVELEPIRRVPDRSIETAVGEPRIRAALRQILREHRTKPRSPSCRTV